MTFRAHRFAVVILLVLAGCGQSNNPPVAPTLALDATSIGCWGGQCVGNFIGTQPASSVQMHNAGQQDLKISAISLSNTTDFSMSISAGGDAGVQPPIDVPGLQTAFLQVIFKPTAAKAYTGTITINSNDAKSPATITLNATGVTPPPPSVDTVSPNSGSPGGGTAVTINGSAFLSGATVTFGGTAATNVSLISNLQLSAKTPVHGAGLVDVVVTNPDNQSATLDGGFNFCVPTDGGSSC